jgi:urease gamma subunit
MLRTEAKLLRVVDARGLKRYVENNAYGTVSLTRHTRDGKSCNALITLQKEERAEVIDDFVGEKLQWVRSI